MNSKQLSKIIILFSIIIQSFSALAFAKANGDVLCKEGDNRCTFVLLSETPTNKNGQLTVVNQTRAATPYSPFSTFKIPNSIIGLEVELIKDAKQSLTYNKETYPPQAWWPSVWKLEQYNLSTAFKFSMVAVYRQLASDIGDKSMQRYLQRFNYGNQDISSGLDQFWLNGSMKISALEQINFLKSFYQNEWSLKESTQTTMKSVMLVSDNNDTKIYAKTGAGKVDDKSMLGWYVGFVENKDGVHYFAMNFNRDTYKEMKSLRTEIVMAHLKSLGITQ